MSLELIEKTLLRIFIDTFLPDWEDKIAWPNVPFTPKDGEPWMFYRLLHSDQKPITLGANGNDQVDGLIQIDVSYPLNAGEGNSRKTIDELHRCFYPRTVSTYGLAVTILSRSKSGASSGSNYFTTPFTVRWRSQLTRNP